MPSHTVKPGFGYFGKVPQRGDFIQAGLATGFANGWSEWLQAAMAVSREQLEESWLEYYMTGPIWHFAFSANVCGEHAMIGSLMPSVDSVGRQFYFSLATPIEHSPINFMLNRKWSMKAEEHILQVLDDEVDLSAWVEATGQACWHQDAIQPDASLQVLMNGDRHTIVAEPASATQLLHHAYQQRFGRYCVWWTNGSEHVPECCVISSGLPLVSQFSALLDGCWEEWGW
ncbi:type VI secretion system-associated protein TagF [Photobacterium swingsii]|uniref:Type VI secretion system-associated protein TagF n=1 Tax=Photobacterium swingsii TaxID=680026 RepID=A0A0J8VF60_9GAMM|nr:type VI secretion system-associated protein TagF [Photobacterium swingsii]KMV31742.1 type VI secretion system-associated protein [Photobacterium swingsii]PSW25353.1 type VI secretion system-associated protein TagF [Photobacterium swingsii]